MSLTRKKTGAMFTLTLQNINILDQLSTENPKFSDKNALDKFQKKKKKAEVAYKTASFMKTR